MPGGTEKAEVRIGADTSGLDSALTKTRGRVQKWGGELASDIGSGVRKAVGTLGDIAGFAGAAGFALMARGVFDFEKALTRLQINARATGADMARIRQEVNALGAQSGANPDDILRGLSKFVELTGDLGTAEASMATWAQVMVGQGADMEDIAAAAAALSQHLHIVGDEAGRAFNILVAQGKQGSVLVKDMATLLPGLLPMFKQFSGASGTGGLAELGALMQVSRRGFGTADEAATGLEAVITAISKRADKMEGLGIKIFDVGPDGTKHFRDLETIIFDLIAKTKGNPELLEKLLGREEAVKTVLNFMQQGKGAVDQFKLSGNQGNEVLKDANTYASSAAGQMDKLNASLKATFSDLVVRNMDAIVSLAKTLAKVVEYLVQHPGIGLALFGAFKGGGYLGSLGEALAQRAGDRGGRAGGNQLSLPGLGGSGGAPGFLPNMATGMRMIGGAMQGAVTGLGIVAAFGEQIDRTAGSMSTMEKSLLVLGTSAAGAAGPLGQLAGPLAGLLLQLQSMADEAAEERAKQITHSEGYLDIAKKFEEAKAHGDTDKMAIYSKALYQRAAADHAVDAQGNIDLNKLRGAGLLPRTGNALESGAGALTTGPLGLFGIGKGYSELGQAKGFADQESSALGDVMKYHESQAEGVTQAFKDGAQLFAAPLKTVADKLGLVADKLNAAPIGVSAGGNVQLSPMGSFPDDRRQGG